MKKALLLFLCSLVFSKNFSQGKSINKLTLETTYSYVNIHKTLRTLIDQADRSSYFDDAFFNDLLKKIVTDKQFTDKEKVQLFYLMQKKLGFSFVGVSYLPPRQNYFKFFSGEVFTWQKTATSLKDLNYTSSNFLALAESELTNDVLISSNALLLATLLNPDSVEKKLVHYTQAENILKSKNPGIFNHYVCLSAAIKQNTSIIANLKKNVTTFKEEAYIEDALCALYSRNNPMGSIKDYILQEQNQENDLSIQTALCALSSKIPPATFDKSVRGFLDETKEKWKKELLKNIIAEKVPFNYSLTSKEWIITKTWPGVVVSNYNEGALITNDDLLEFDAN